MIHIHRRRGITFILFNFDVKSIVIPNLPSLPFLALLILSLPETFAALSFSSRRIAFTLLAIIVLISLLSTSSRYKFERLYVRSTESLLYQASVVTSVEYLRHASCCLFLALLLSFLRPPNKLELHLERSSFQETCFHIFSLSF